MLKCALYLQAVALGSALVGRSSLSVTRTHLTRAAPATWHVAAARPWALRAATFGGEFGEAAAKMRALAEEEVPRLTEAELGVLASAGRVERRERRGRVGDALVVVETALSVDEVWRVLNDVEAWPARMRGVRSASVRPSFGSDRVRAAFKVTKLRLPANLVFERRRDDDRVKMLTFELDPLSINLAVEDLAGYWRVEESPRNSDRTRVSLRASIGACAIVPTSAMDYVAEKALRRASDWLLLTGDHLTTTDAMKLRRRDPLASTNLI